MTPSRGLIDRLTASALGRWLYRYRRLVPLASFAAGAASFFLVERQAQLAQWLTAFLLLGWIWLIGEGLFSRLLTRVMDVQVTEKAARYVAQSLHQETLFFILPFFLATTNWASGQIAFTATVIGAAIISTIDPLYFGVIAGRRWLFLGFHAFALFAALLTALPIMLQLTTSQSLGLAAAAMAIFALPSLSQAIQVKRWWRWFVLTGLAASLAAFAWLTRIWIPPATLRVTETAITQQVDAANRSPANDLEQIDAAQLKSGGLYAFTAIKAPRGLHQPILHRWSHEGETVDTIGLDIVGGRAEGYRAWSHKSAFPDDPSGSWRVSVITDDGQLIGVVRFEVN